MLFSLIIPVYNRPDEVDELLESLSKTTYDQIFEIVLIEDGSTLRCQDVAQKYGDKLKNYLLLYLAIKGSISLLIFFLRQ